MVSTKNSNNQYVTWYKLIGVNLAALGVLTTAIIAIVSNSLAAHSDLPTHKGGTAVGMFRAYVENTNSQLARLYEIVRQNQLDIKKLLKR